MKTKTHDDPFARLEQQAHRGKAEEDAAKLASTARARLVLGKTAAYCFFATLALRLKVRMNWDIETACTEGKHLDLNPDWFNALPLEQAKGVVAHETLHNALMHPARRGARDPKRWNIACDLAVNPTVVASGLQLPPGGLFPGEGQYAHLPAGKSAEEYYSLLQDPPKPPEGDDSQDGAGDGEGDGQGQGKPPPDPGKCGGVQDPGDGSQAAARESQAEWEVATAQAHQIAKARGALPAGIDRLVAEMLAPKVSWKDVLREFVSSHAKNDYSWSPPNRRFIHQGLYLPGLRSEELGELVLAIDTSGSIGEQELAEFGGEAQGILDSFNGVKLTIVYHDTEVAHVQRWEPSDGPLKLEAKGGGGTCHRCIFDWIAQQGDAPTCLVCLTDLYTSFPKSAPNYPVLWAVTGGNDSKPPFGQRVEIR